MSQWRTDPECVVTVVTQYPTLKPCGSAARPLASTDGLCRTFVNRDDVSARR
jgi:hypothetical protein